MKLLIAEDDLTTRIMLQGLVRQWGYEPVLATDGDQALDYLRGSDPPRLLLLDWMMPGISGLELCRRLRLDESEDPPFIILLTARSNTEDIVAGLDAGANDYVSKPFEHAELRARLQVGKRMLDMQAELNRTRQELKYRATHDALTGLPNRAAVLEGLESDLARVRRDGSQLCIGLVDVDHFKQINDTHGHLVGDAALCALANHLHSALRPYDRIGRFGGEEFLIVTSAIDDCCYIPFERIRADIATTRFECEGVALSLTISIGVTFFSPAWEQIGISELLASADNALYTAKAQGRNRTIMD